MPFMTKEVDASQGDDGPYIAMSDQLALYPHNGTSTAVWDMEDDRSLGLLEGHTSQIEWASLNDMKKTAVTCHDEANPVRAVKIWSLETMQCTANLMATSPVTRLLNDRLLLGSSNGPIKVWDIGGSAPVALMDLEGHTGHTMSIDASDTSNVALSGSSDKYVRLWDLRTGQCVRVMEGHASPVFSVSMDSACKTAVSGSGDATVKLWDLGSGRCIATYDHGQGVDDVMMHELGSSFLASGFKPGRLKAWALGTDKPLLEADLGPNGMHFVASPDLSMVATCYADCARDVLGVFVYR
jgi:WD40 repeat protein